MPLTQYYLVLRRLSTDPKIHDLGWPFYVKFSLLQTAVSAIMLHTYRSLYIAYFLLYDITNRNVQKRTVKLIRRILRLD